MLQQKLLQFSKYTRSSYFNLVSWLNKQNYYFQSKYARDQFYQKYYSSEESIENTESSDALMENIKQESLNIQSNFMFLSQDFKNLLSAKIKKKLLKDQRSSKDQSNPLILSSNLRNLLSSKIKKKLFKEQRLSKDQPNPLFLNSDFRELLSTKIKNKLFKDQLLSKDKLQLFPSDTQDTGLNGNRQKINENFLISSLTITNKSKNIISINIQIDREKINKKGPINLIEIFSNNVISNQYLQNQKVKNMNKQFKSKNKTTSKKQSSSQQMKTKENQNGIISFDKIQNDTIQFSINQNTASLFGNQNFTNLLKSKIKKELMKKMPDLQSSHISNKELYLKKKKRKLILKAIKLTLTDIQYLGQIFKAISQKVKKLSKQRQKQIINKIPSEIKYLTIEQINQNLLKSLKIKKEEKVQNKEGLQITAQPTSSEKQQSISDKINQSSLNDFSQLFGQKNITFFIQTLKQEVSPITNNENLRNILLYFSRNRRLVNLQLIQLLTSRISCYISEQNKIVDDQLVRLYLIIMNGVLEDKQIALREETKYLKEDILENGQIIRHTIQRFLKQYIQKYEKKSYIKELDNFLLLSMNEMSPYSRSWFKHRISYSFYEVSKIQNHQISLKFCSIKDNDYATQYFLLKMFDQQEINQMNISKEWFNKINQQNLFKQIHFQVKLSLRKIQIYYFYQFREVKQYLSIPLFRELLEAKIQNLNVTEILKFIHRIKFKKQQQQQLFKFQYKSVFFKMVEAIFTKILQLTNLQHPLAKRHRRYILRKFHLINFLYMIELYYKESKNIEMCGNIFQNLVESYSEFPLERRKPEHDQLIEYLWSKNYEFNTISEEIKWNYLCNFLKSQFYYVKSQNLSFDIWKNNQNNHQQNFFSQNVIQYCLNCNIIAPEKEICAFIARLSQNQSEKQLYLNRYIQLFMYYFIHQQNYTSLMFQNLVKMVQKKILENTSNLNQGFIFHLKNKDNYFSQYFFQAFPTEYENLINSAKDKEIKLNKLNKYQYQFIENIQKGSQYEKIFKKFIKNYQLSTHQIKSFNFSLLKYKSKDYLFLGSNNMRKIERDFYEFCFKKYVMTSQDLCFLWFQQSKSEKNKTSIFLKTIHKITIIQQKELRKIESLTLEQANLNSFDIDNQI